MALPERYTATFMPLASRSHGTISEPKVMPAVDWGWMSRWAPRLLKSSNRLPDARMDCIQ
jgi:hypothetical protein